MTKRDDASSSFARWLGRQVGHIRCAIRQHVGEPAQTIYRHQTVQQHAAPHDPDLILRRTITDEVLCRSKPPSATNSCHDGQKTRSAG
ncbi:MAG: hypothetical protein IT448_01720 [Phycisphaerales bacterium]|nr:hypothetical protein [Phycisphaerales bacterium]